MKSFSDEELLKLNHQGLIPGPSESSEAFAARANYCLSLNEHLSEELKTCLSGEVVNSSAFLKVGSDTVSLFYDFSPLWIPAFFSNYQLAPWHGGCAWIFQVTEDSPTGALLQLRKAFYRSPKYLGIYQRDELIAHELSHVGRMAYQEPKFEEILAYYTSSSTFRRWLGPLIQSSYESMIFVIILALIFFIDALLISFGHGEGYLMAMWMKLIPLGLVIFALIRLWRRQRTFKMCLELLKACLHEEKKATAVIYRLKDDEIETLAKMSVEQIKAFVLSQKNSSLRWKLIAKAYFCS